MRRRFVGGSVARVLLPLLFVGSCSALVPLAFTLADPLTNVSLGSIPGMRFPVVVVAGERANVQFLAHLRRVPAPPAGWSYLVPRGRERAIQQAINAARPPGTEGMWILRVRHLTPERQRIELFWMDDGYAGGAYEATRTSVRPLHQKMTGPGFAIVCGGIALLLDSASWWTVLALVRRRRARR